MTVVGPLTTTFQAPSSCTTQLYQVFSESESSYVQGPLFTSGSDCFPSGYDPEPANYYSPGVCPHGHTVACSSLASVSTETETAVACCPTDLNYSCPVPTATSQGGSPQIVLGCTTTWIAAEVALPDVVVVTDGTAGSTTTTSETAGGITAYAVRIHFRSGDPTPAPRTDDPGGVSGLAQPTSPTVPIPTQLSIPQETSPSPSGLSTPAIVGIAVGSAVGVLLAIGSMCFFIRRRRRRRRAETELPPPPPVPPKELSATPVSYRTVPPPYELSEEALPRRPSTIAAKKHLSASVSSARSPLREERESGVLGYRPVELEAESLSPARQASLRNTASPESASSGWTDKQARGAATPMPWI